MSKIGPDDWGTTPEVSVSIYRRGAAWRAVIDRDGSNETVVLDCARLDELLRDIGIDLHTVLGRADS
jgi:hypothetical protein